MTPSNPLSPKPHRTAPLYVLTAALASAAGAALTAFAHLGHPSILGVPVPNLAFWQDQDFPAREGWPVNKLPETERDPTDPSQPDLFLRQLRAESQAHNEGSAPPVATRRDLAIAAPVVNHQSSSPLRNYATHRRSPERAATAPEVSSRSRPVGERSAPRRSTTTPAAPRRVVRERSSQAAPRPVRRAAESVIQKPPKRSPSLEPAAPSRRSDTPAMPPAAPAAPPAAPPEQASS